MTTDRRASVASPAVAAEAYRRRLAQYRQGRRADALADLRLAMSTAPDNPDYAYDLGVILLEGEAHAEATECFASTTRLQPTAAESLVNLSKCQPALDRAEDAERAARRAADLAPGSAATHHNLGLALRKLNRHAEAVESLRRAVELEPKSAPLWNDLGGALQGVEAFDESERVLRHAIELDPDNPRALWNLAVLKLQGEAPRDAVPLFGRYERIRTGAAERMRVCRASLMDPPRAAQGVPYIATLEDVLVDTGYWAVVH